MGQGSLIFHELLDSALNQIVSKEEESSCIIRAYVIVLLMVRIFLFSLFNMCARCCLLFNSPEPVALSSSQFSNGIRYSPVFAPELACIIATATFPLRVGEYLDILSLGNKKR